MISFNYETNFKLKDEIGIANWVEKCITNNGFKVGEINYIFCDDDYLHSLNVEFLNHDTYTDIISFDYTMGKLISGDIFISVERVEENALKYSQTFENEISRVIIHGILHYCGYADKTEDEKIVMRAKEDECLTLLN